LGLRVLEEWDEPLGQGAIFAFGTDETGSLEIYQMNPVDPRYDPAFMSRIANDKIDIQLRTDSVDSWVEGLQNAWPFDGPDDLPWGQRWIKLRDPDGLLIAIYEERKGVFEGAA
jgi:catechol 2,3-dioxygenase-like lactoylglutathione lyase family enzyme